LVRKHTCSTVLEQRSHGKPGTMHPDQEERKRRKKKRIGDRSGTRREERRVNAEKTMRKKRERNTSKKEGVDKILGSHSYKFQKKKGGGKVSKNEGRSGPW